MKQQPEQDLAVVDDRWLNTRKEIRHDSVEQWHVDCWQLGNVHVFHWQQQQLGTHTHTDTRIQTQSIVFIAGRAVFVSNDVVQSRMTTAPVRHYPSMALVLLLSSVPCRHRSRPLPSSPGLHSGSCQRLATKNWKTEANLAENSWGWSSPAQLWPGDGKTARYG